MGDLYVNLRVSGKQRFIHKLEGLEISDFLRE